MAFEKKSASYMRKALIGLKKKLNIVTRWAAFYFRSDISASGYFLLVPRQHGVESL